MIYFLTYISLYSIDGILSMLVDSIKHLTVDMHSIFASQISHPFMFELLLKVGHYQFAYIDICLRTLYLLAESSFNFIYIINS